MVNAPKKLGTNVLPGTNVPEATDQALARDFSALVIPFTAGRLAKAAKRTKECAKGWKAARQCPSGASLINMARRIPAVRAWLIAEAMRGTETEFDSDLVATRAITAAMAEISKARGGG